MNGSKRQRSPGVWELRVYLGKDPVTGRKRWTSRTFRGPARAAQTALAGLVTEVDRGRAAVTLTEGTVGFLLVRWLEFQATDLSPTTMKTYRSQVRTYLMPHLGPITLEALTVADIDRFYTALLTRPAAQGGPLAPTTVVQTHAILRKALKQAGLWGWMTTNPADRARKPRVTKRRHNLPPLDALADLMRRHADTDPEMAALWWLAASLGSRRGEVCALRWRDVNLDRAELTISRSVITVGGQRAEKGTKSHGIRKIELDPDTVAVLRRHRVRCETEAALVKKTIGPDSFLFSGDPARRSPWHPDTVTHRWRKAADAAGLPHVRLHDLRHLAASVLLENGISITTVSHRLGHERVSTTLDIYAAVMPGSGREAADVMGRLMGGFAPP